MNNEFCDNNSPYYQTQTLEQKRKISLLKSGLGYLGYEKKNLHCVFIDCHHMLQLDLLLWEMSVQSCVNYIISFELDIGIHLFITLAFFYLFQFPL